MNDPLIIISGFTLALLLFLFLILVINLLTFYRLRAREASPVARRGGGGDERGGDPWVALAGDHPTRPFPTQTHEGTKGDPRVPTQTHEGTKGDPRVPTPNPHHSRPYGLREPFLSILVPARNEEGCIEACVHSLVGQRYERLEVLVLDDASRDTTASIVQRIIDELATTQTGRLQLLRGQELPQGWIGKNFACHQLAKHAQGDYLLFTDADTVHAPETARAVIDCMHDFDVTLLTAQPEHELRSLGERLVVPLLNFTIMTLLPVALVALRPEPGLATGNGQLLCFHRSTYEGIGGHAAVKGRILEDVLLARAVKKAGYRMAFVDALELVRCRMYRSFAEVWDGFSKNLFAFYNYSLPFALVALLLNLALFVVPPLLVLASLVIHLPSLAVLFAASAYALAALMRVLLTLRFTRTQRGLMLLLCLLHPVSIMLECLILLNSIRWRHRKKGTVWKGRQYA